MIDISRVNGIRLDYRSRTTYPVVFIVLFSIKSIFSLPSCFLGMKFAAGLFPRGPFGLENKENFILPSLEAILMSIRSTINTFILTFSQQNIAKHHLLKIVLNLQGLSRFNVRLS